MSIGTAQLVLFGVAPLTCGVWLAGTRAPMPVETAEVIFLAIAVPMWAVWLFGTWFALSRLRKVTSSFFETLLANLEHIV